MYINLINFDDELIGFYPAEIVVNVFCIDIPFAAAGLLILCIEHSDYVYSFVEHRHNMSLFLAHNIYKKSLLSTYYFSLTYVINLRGKDINFGSSNFHTEYQ